MDLFSQTSSKKNKKLRVVRVVDYVVEEVDPVSLLKGFKELRAVTFSSSLSMLKKLSELGFSKVNLVISLSEDFKEAKELHLVRLLTEEGDEVSKVVPQLDFEVRYFPKSHSKFYLLQREDGTKRLILGSLNFSVSAWSGRQQEEVLYSDNPDLIEFYEGIFNEIWSSSKEVVDSKSVNRELKRKGLSVNIENLELTPDNLEVVKQLHDLTVGVTIKNLVASVNPKVLKAQADEEKKKLSQIHASISRIASMKENLLVSSAEKVSKLLSEDQGEITKSLTYEKGKWLLSGVLAITADKRDQAIENLAVLKEILKLVKEHGGTEETVSNILESIIFSFSGSYLWAVRQREENLPESFPVFGILAGTSKAGKSLTLSIISMLTHGELITVEYSKKLNLKGWECSIGKSEANIFEYYFDGRLSFARGVFPLLVNEVNEGHLKDRKLYNIVKTISNTKIPKQHGVAVMSMNVSLFLPPEIARRVFFLEYSFSLKEHKKLEGKLRPLVTKLNNSLFYYFLSQTNPYEVSVSPDDPLKYTREFFKTLARESGVSLPIPDRYIGDVESKSYSELKHVFSLTEEIPTVKHPKEGVECYLLEKEKFRYPPPVEVLVEDRGNYYYLHKKKTDRICGKRKFWEKFLS